ncbi:MAG: hypothetical protein IJZ24_01710 [Clostridia bacterium]|nr:hypothetical protein [Clostridia bacterium]
MAQRSCARYVAWRDSIFLRAPQNQYAILDGVKSANAFLARSPPSFAIQKPSLCRRRLKKKPKASKETELSAFCYEK